MDLALPARLLLGVALWIVLARWAPGGRQRRVLYRQLWMLAVFAVLIGLAVLVAPLYHRWYRHMRRDGRRRPCRTTRIGARAGRGLVGGNARLHPLE